MEYQKALLLLIAVTLLAACGSPESDWADASRQNTLGAYRDFLKHYPTDSRAQEASQAILHIQDERAWEAAQVASNIDAFSTYLQKFPNGGHAQAAQENVLKREQSYAWSLLPSDKTPASLRGFLALYPSGPEADQARSELHALTAYRAEFATARRMQVADQRRHRVARRLKSELSELIILKPDTQDDRYRLTSTPMSERQVNRLCERAAEARQACWIVKAAS